MGTSTDGIICFGYQFDEGDDFDALPWEPWYLEEWWYEEILKYEPPFEIYDERGYWLPEITEAQRKEYYQHRRDFEEANPLPVEEVVHCSDNYPMRILAVPGTVTVNRRGYPERLGDILTVLSVDDEAFGRFKEFCDKYVNNLEDTELGWWLCSYWG